MRASKHIQAWLCVLSLGAIPTTALAQIDDAEEATHTFRPFVSAGISQFVGDLGEGNQFATGPSVRAGLQTPGSAVALGLSYWSNVNRFRLTSLHFELTQDLTAKRRVTPYLFASVGHTWSSYLGTATAAAVPGTSGAFGLGVTAALTSRVLLVADARLRTDAGSWNGEWRVAGELSPNHLLASVQSRSTSIVSSWMTAVGGPWVTTEPAWGLRVVRDRGVLALHLVH